MAQRGGHLHHIPVTYTITITTTTIFIYISTNILISAAATAIAAAATFKTVIHYITTRYCSLPTFFINQSKYLGRQVAICPAEGVILIIRMPYLHGQAKVTELYG